jgi:hypothetical protein
MIRAANLQFQRIYCGEYGHQLTLTIQVDSKFTIMRCLRELSTISCLDDFARYDRLARVDLSVDGVLDTLP